MTSSELSIDSSELAMKKWLLYIVVLNFLLKKYFLDEHDAVKAACLLEQSQLW